MKRRVCRLDWCYVDVRVSVFTADVFRDVYHQVAEHLDTAVDTRPGVAERPAFHVPAVVSRQVVSGA